jgi:hypothetical protein
MLRGFGVFGDDVSLVEPRTLALQPFRRAFHIDLHTWDLLEPFLNARVRDGDPIVPGYFCPPQWAEQHVPVKWMIFPRYAPDQTPALEPMTLAESVGVMLACSTSLPRAPRLSLSTATRLAETTRCYRLRTGDLLASVALLQRLVHG